MGVAVLVGIHNGDFPSRAAASAVSSRDGLEAVVQTGLPGAVVVASGPELRWEGAVGLADLEAGEPLAVAHRFRVASVTKLFFATAVGALVRACYCR